MPTEETTTTDPFPPKRQRAALDQLAKALDAVSTALRTDECGDFRLIGRRGHIYAIPPRGFHLYIACDTARGWTWAKKQLAGLARPVQDGDEEGILLLAKLPSTAAEAALVRRYAGISKHPARTPEHIEALRKVARRNGQHSAENRARAGVPLPT